MDEWGQARHHDPQPRISGVSMTETIKKRLSLKPRSGHPPASAAEPWLVLVVDDDPQVHAMTEVLLRDFTFQGRGFEVLNAYSAAEAREVLTRRPEIPVVLLDVVMETDAAGLDLARDIREGMGNDRLRIILRTGQPGEAPERDVMLLYDINDYRAKAELTAQKLFTALVGALRSWTHIDTIAKLNTSLEERVIERTRELDQALRFSEQLVEMIPSPLWYKDSQGGYRLVNRAFRALFGDDAAQVPDLESSDAALLSGDSSRIEFEAAVTSGNGGHHTMMVAKGPVRDGDGNPIGIVGVMTDISLRKALESELTRLATIDPLTATANRRHFLAQAAQEMDRAIRYARPFSVVMIDIDHFKAVNDTYGHAVGDAVLGAVAAACRTLLRDVDCLGRIGGEEFALLLPETVLTGAIDAADRLRQAIAQAGINLAERRLHVTASLGVAERRPEETDFDHLLARADAALYRAKAAGRDRVEAS